MAQYVFPPPPASSMMGISDTGSVANRPPMAIQELAHEVRQPLSVIEALAFYLEMTTADESVSCHLRKIQAMVLQANRILSEASGS